MTGRPPLPPKQRKRREHGTNACYRWGVVGGDYRNGCRCVDCTTAGVLYEKRRTVRKARGWEPYVDNAAAREHLLWLAEQGIGLRAVAEASGLSRSALQDVRSGVRTSSRREWIERVLAVGTHRAAPGARIDAGPTLALIDELVALGHTKGSIAVRLGATKRALQIGKQGTILRLTADKVEALHRELTASRDAGRDLERRRQADYRRRAAA